jgi:hypothetical protein
VRARGRDHQGSCRGPAPPARTRGRVNAEPRTAQCTCPDWTRWSTGSFNSAFSTTSASAG